jgi:hypothetical protein
MSSRLAGSLRLLPPGFQKSLFIKADQEGV